MSNSTIRLRSDRSRFSIDPLLCAPRTPRCDRASVQGARCGGAGVRVSWRSRHRPARPALAPGRATFVRLGFDHILDGIDHLLFLFCLVLPLRRFGQLVVVVTAFTVAHSITLFAAAFGLAPTRCGFRRSSKRSSPCPSSTWRSRTSWSGRPGGPGRIGAVPTRCARPAGAHARPARPLDDRVRVRAGARLRVLVRAEADAAVRRLSPGDVARSRSTSASSSASCWCWRSSPRCWRFCSGG